MGYVPICKIFKYMRSDYEQEESHVRGSPQQSEIKHEESRYTHHAVNSNNIYGIPQQQYEHIYGHEKQESLTGQLPTYDTLDYGQKLVANHNLLKDLLQIVDCKIENKRNIQQSRVKQKLERSQIRQKEKKGETIEFKGHRLQQKMAIVRDKLKDIIGFINSQIQHKNSNKQQQEVIKSILEWQPSLVYSKDPSDIRASESFNRSIVIDKHKLDNAKQVISRQYLHPNGHSKAEDVIVSNGPYMKSSLERISQVQSGDQIEREQYYQSEPTQPRRIPSRNQTAKHSIRYEDYNPDLDETGKMIMSTINKKTKAASTTTIHHQNQKASPTNLVIQSESEVKQPQQQKQTVQIKQIPFRKMGNGLHMVDTVVSRQSLEEPRKSRFHPDKRGEIDQNSKIEQVDSNMYIAVASSLGNQRGVQQMRSSQHQNMSRNSSMPHIRQSTIVQYFPGHYVPNSAVQQPQAIRQMPKIQSPQYENRHRQNPEIRQPPTFSYQQNIGSPSNGQRAHSIQINRSPLPSNRQPSPSMSRAQKPTISYQPQARPSSASHSGSNIKIVPQPRPVVRPMVPNQQQLKIQKTPSITRNINFEEARRHIEGSSGMREIPTQPMIRPPGSSIPAFDNFAPPRYPREGIPQSRVFIEQRPPRQLSNSRAESQASSRGRSIVKKQLSDIMETSEYSGQNSATRLTSHRSESFSKVNPLSSSGKNHLVSRESHHKLKKRGIQVTNHSFSNKRIA